MSNTGIELIVLGAGQEVGRSCVVMHIGGHYIMFDCGMHLGYRDARKFPDFSLLPFHDRLTEMITAVVITHFHLDHCAGLPYLTAVHGYAGPIYMTYPTKAIMPIMLEDYHKVVTERLGDRQWYTKQDIAACMRRVVAVDLNQLIQVAPGVEICALYAGHVLGAAMFHVRVGSQSVLYTGDYNTTPDRHLGAAQLARLRPDVLVSESTYATTLRDSKVSRERDFVTQVVRCVGGGGKVLIPVFAVGRAQELLILVEEAWGRLGLHGRVPIYFSGVMAARANALYRGCVNWANAQVRAPGMRHSAFAFEAVAPWDPSYATRPGPCLLFASPGMLTGGTSLEVFKQWAPDPLNLVVLPGYQVAGTVGGKLMSGRMTELKLGSATVVVRCEVRFLSFSAHADVKGILQLIAATAPRHVVLVHGEKTGMDFLAARITRSMGVPCICPANGDWSRVHADPPSIPLQLQLGPSWTQPACAAPVSTYAEDTGEEVPAFPLPTNCMVVSGVTVAKQVSGMAVEPLLLTDTQFSSQYTLEQPRFQVHYRTA